MRDRPIASITVEARRGQTVYPEPYAKVVAGRTKRKLGDIFGLTNFGVNLTHLEPGAASALFHGHAVQDEFVYILEGNPTVLCGDAEHQLAPGDCMGFKAGNGQAHQLINRTGETVTYLEVGDRTPGDLVVYPRDDFAASLGPDGNWVMTRKDGTPF
jgi:uncharacterized cupin superfamily protein